MQKNSIQNIISLDSDPAARTKVSTQRNALEFNYQKSIDLVTAQRSQNMIFQKNDDVQSYYYWLFPPKPYIFVEVTW